MAEEPTVVTGGRCPSGRHGPNCNKAVNLPAV